MRYLAAFYGLACAAICQAADCRFILADQSNYGQKLGFYLNLENTSASGPCRLETLNIALGIAGNGAWKFIVQRPPLRVNTDYKAVAIITDASAELWVNDIFYGRTYTPFTQFSGALTAGMVPSYASAPASYLTVQSGLSIASSSGQKQTLDFQASAKRPVGLVALAPGSPQSGAWLKDAGAWTITANFRFTDIADAVRTPLFDRYLQSLDADWPGKIRSDIDLENATALEDNKLSTWGPVQTFDTYGGLLNAGWRVAGPKGDGPGFFQVTKQDGRWWLVSPAGNPVFYIGLSTAPSLNWDCTPVTGRTNLFTELPSTTGVNATEVWRQNAWGDTGTSYACFNTVNLMRKYGPDWKSASLNRTAQRVKAWGFSGLGKWSDQTADLPLIPVLSRVAVPLLARHPDIFDPSVRSVFQRTMELQLAPRLKDPRVVGYTMGSEYDEIVTSDEIPAILAKASTVPAKRALIDEALSGIYGGNLTSMAAAWKLTSIATPQDLYGRTPTLAAPDVEYLRRFYARAYYKYVYETYKGIDPNHLYFGNWIVPNWWVNDEDWRMIAAYTDVIGYDRYALEFADDSLAALIRESGKPVFVGEFSFPAHYGLSRGFRAYDPSASDDADSGARYRRWMQQAIANPFCVGVSWFQYRDEPVSGRGPGVGADPVYGEDFAFGLVDVGDRPKWDLVEPVRAANLTAAKRRLTAVQPSLAEGGVMNAASFAKGAPVAPGSLITIFGAGLEAASLKMGGRDVPVLYSSPTQLNAQVPWELTGISTAQLTITGSASIAVPIAQYSPGIFAVTSSGEIITIYANGLGPVENQPATGFPSPTSPLTATLAMPTVTIGAAQASVLFSGLAPGWTGLYQVNAQLPPGLPAGVQPVRISIGGLTSNAGSITVR